VRQKFLANWEDEEVYEFLVLSVLQGRLSPEQAAEKCCPLFRTDKFTKRKLEKTVELFYGLLNKPLPYLAIATLRGIWGASAETEHTVPYGP